MSSDNGCWAADQGSSSVHQSVPKRSTQAAKLSEDVVSSQPELEESSESTTKRRMLVSWDDVVPQLVPRWLLMVMVLVLSIFGFWLQEKVMQLPRPLRLLALVQMLALLLILAWNEHLHRNYMHMHKRVSQEVVQLVKILLVVTMVGMAGRMLSLWWQEVLLVEMVVVLLIINLDRVVNFWHVATQRHGRVGTHGHGIVSPVKCMPHDRILDNAAWVHYTSNLEWVLDAAASVHRTSDFWVLHEIKLHEMDNKDFQIHGSVRTDRFDFSGVQFVPDDDKRNVVSVSQLARDHGLVTVFEPSSCCIKEKFTGKIVGKGHLRNDGMYILDFLRIAGQNVAGDRGASSGGEHGGGGRGNGGRGDSSMAEGRGGRDGRRGGTRASMGVLSLSRFVGLLGLSRFVLVLCLCIAACISLLQFTSRGAGVIWKLASFNNHDFHSLLGFSLLFISNLGMLQSASRKLVKQICSLFQESPQEHHRRLFGLSRFDDVTTGHRRYQLRIGPLLASLTNTAPRREQLLLDSGASYHTIWTKQIIASYPKDLKDHTEPPTWDLGGIVSSIAVKSSGYLSFGKIKLDGALLAPESRFNLISVGQLAVQYQVKVIFDDEGFIIKRKQDGATIGGGKMTANHLYQLEYFEPPEGLFALCRTPDFKIFGKSDPGRPQVNTDPCPARSTTTEETVSPSANQQEATESSSLGERRSRKRNGNYFGPLWFNG